MEKDSYESSHEASIQAPIREFGTKHETEIRRLYDSERKTQEEKAKIKNYITILTQKSVRDIMEFKYPKRNLESALEK